MKSTRSFGFVAAVAVALSGAIASPRVIAQDAQARGADLLALARKAVGGDDKLRAVKALQANGTFKRMAGNNTLEGDLDIQIQLPDKYRRNESVGIAGGPTVDRTEALNGTEIWDDTDRGGGPGGGGFGGFGGGRGGRGGFGGGGGGGGARRGGGQANAGGGAQGGDANAQANGGRGQFDPERLRQLQLRMRQADFSRLLIGLLLTTDSPVTWVGTAESPDGNADVLEIKPADGDATRLFLDASTHMPLMLTWQGPQRPAAARGGRAGRGRGDANAAPNDQANAAPAAPPAPVTLAMHLSDYKAVNGVKLPFTITRSANDQTIEDLTIKSYKVNPSLKPSTFTQPKP